MGLIGATAAASRVGGVSASFFRRQKLWTVFIASEFAASVSAGEDARTTSRLVSPVASSVLPLSRLAEGTTNPLSIAQLILDDLEGWESRARKRRESSGPSSVESVSSPSISHARIRKREARWCTLLSSRRITSFADEAWHLSRRAPRMTAAL
eukprot:scaffold71690_cov32-Tisochrysis_lutea.AAC.4